MQVKLMEEICTPAQKKEIVTKLTDAMVSIERRRAPLAAGK
jgi:phenylpyruvate tautomerase PptA (4-oxalocrotonate tautomerase family)